MPTQKFAAIRKIRGQGLAVAIILLGAALRFFRIAQQSYWNDEGNSLGLAGRGLADIVRAVAADIHPPGYYLALSAWRSLAGDSELALRAFSALAGVVLVALLYRLGRHYFDRRVGLAAALLAAVHPFLIYYSQEARMYSLLATLSAASFLLFSLWLRSSRPPAPPIGNWQLGLAFALATAAGLYTHYAFGFIILAQNVAALGGLLAHGKRSAPLLTVSGEAARAQPSWLLRFAAWLSWQALALLLYLPWLPIALRQLTSWPAERQAQPIGLALADLGRTLSFGRTVSLEAAAAGLIGSALLLVFGMRARGQSITPLLWLLIPAGLTLSFGLLTEAFAKFLLIAVPAFCLLLGAALARPPARRQPPTSGLQPPASSLRPLPTLWLFSLAVFSLATFRSINNVYFHPAYQRDNYRGIAQHLADVARPGDAVITISPNQVEAFGYYHRDGAPIYPLPRTRPLDPAQTIGELEAIAEDHSRLFVLFWGEQQADPDQVVESWLNNHAFKAGDVWYGQVRLATYATAAPAGEMTSPSGARFGEQIVLEGYSFQPATLAAGDILQITLFWRADSALQERYKVFVHIYADENQPPVAQQDGEPGGGLAPTNTWLPGQRYADNHGVLLPADLPPGRYTLMVGLYNLFDDRRLPVILGEQSAGDRLPLTSITITGE